MTTRHVTTAVTLVALCVIVMIGAVVGFNALFAPLPGAEDEPSAAVSSSCDAPSAKKRERLRSAEVTVNVFNAGTRSGLAGATVDAFRARGFRGGLIGNAPSDTKVRRAQVWIVEGEEHAGRLVARQLGPRTPVVTEEEDLGDGVDVLVGNGFRALVRAPRSIVVKVDASGCE
jgi:LytR cell envelope-related transcriptional attenuator